MADVGKLNWRITADSRQFNKSIGKAKRAMQDLKKAVAVVAVGAAGFAAFVKGAFNSADQLGKTSREIGVSVEKLQEFRFAAERSGGSAQQMDSALRTFTKRLGEARQGTGALTTFLKKFNPELLESLKNATDTEDAMRLYADAMNDIKSPADRAALSAAAFTKANGFMITALGDGSKGLDALGEAARKNSTFLTEDMTKSAELANDKIGDLIGSFKSLGTYLAVSFADDAIAAVDWFKKALPAALLYFDSFILNTIANLNTLIGLYKVATFNADEAQTHFDKADFARVNADRAQQRGSDIFNGKEVKTKDESAANSAKIMLDLTTEQNRLLKEMGGLPARAG